MISSPRLADEARGLVCASGSSIRRDLWIWTQRTRPLDLSIAHARRHDRIGRLAVFHPLFERAHHVEAVRPLTASAMTHAGHHEQPIRALNLLLAAETLSDPLVVLHAVARRDLRIAPAVVLQQLSAAVEER